MEVYASTTPGIGGKIRLFPEDFVVEEVLKDGSKAQIRPEKAVQIARRGRYLFCILVKRNWDTISAVETIAKHLGIGAESISIAGIKDARAVTAQHISIGRVTPEQVLQVKIRDISLYPLGYRSEKIHPGLLLGNHFNIIIRAITLSSNVVKNRMESIVNELSNLGGIPNFFGHQRFGTIRPITHIVGNHIVQGEWKKAALAFLAMPSGYEHPERRRARQELRDTEDFKAALSHFPRQLTYERLMLRHLAEHPRDYVGAFRRLPLKLCKLFVQAYQSYLFNKFLSARMRQEMPLSNALNGDYTIKVDSARQVALPLIGFKQQISKGRQGEIEREILEAENVKPNNFRILQIREISSGGGLRLALASIRNLVTEKPTLDQINHSKLQIKMEFMLPSGSYATVLLREFMKPQNPVEVGF
jgi:tRNA pseudouridine13 synthase